MAEFDDLAGAGIDAAKVQGRYIRSADHMRNQYKDDFVVDDLMRLGTKNILEQGQLGQAGDAGHADQDLLVYNPRQDAGLTLAQPDRLLRGFVGENRLGDAADGLGAA